MNAKSKISGMLPKTFKAAKCKTSLKLVVSRIKLLKNKREAQVKQMRRDLAQLLETGQEQTARIRVEHVIREEKTMSAYDLIEVYCELIAARLPIIESQKHCPIDLKEAISSVIFAGPRCADLPELIEIRKQLTAKYGKEFTTAAIEVRPDCGVNRLIVEKLSARAPDVEMKMKVLTQVAKEHNIKWEPKAFEELTPGPMDDLLNGPTSFTSANNIKMESAGFSPLPTHNRSNDSNIEMPKNDVPTNTYSREHNASLNRSNWSLEFKDAASAAQAAAESAEMASMAARAAAELASRGSMSRQHSTESIQPSRYDTKYGESRSSRRSKLESAPVEDSRNVEGDGTRDMYDMKPRIQNVQRDNVVQASANLVAKSLSHSNSETGSVTFARSHSGGSVKDDTPDVIRQESDVKSYVERPESSLETQFASKNYKNETNEDDDEVLEKLDKRHAESNYSTYSSNYDDYIWDDHDNTTKVDSSDVVFDGYVSDTDGNNIFETFNEESASYSFLQQKQNSSLSSDMAFQSSNQQKSRSLFNESSLHMHPEKGNYHVDYVEAISKTDISSLSDDNLQPTYDSDGHESESEDEREKLEHSEVTKRNSFLRTDSSSRKGSFSAVSGLRSSYDDDEKEIQEDMPSSFSTVSPADNGMSIDAESNLLEKRWRSPGHSVRDSQRTARNVNYSRDPDETGRDLMEKGTSFPASYEENDLSRGLNFGRLSGGLKNKVYDGPSYATNPIIDDSSEKEILSSVTESSTSSGVRSEKKFSKDSVSEAYTSKPRVAGDVYFDKIKDQVSLGSGEDTASSFEGLTISSSQNKATSFTTEKPAISQYSRTSMDAENPAREIYSQQRHRTNSNANSYEEQSYSVGRAYRTDDTSSPSTEKSTLSRQIKKPSSSEVSSQELYGRKQQVKVDNDSSSRMPKYSSLDVSDEEELSNVAKRDNSNTKLSRRTRVLPSVAKEDTSSRTTGRSAGGTSVSKEKSSDESTEPFPEKTRHVRESNNKSSSRPHEAKMKFSDIESSSVEKSSNLMQYEPRQSSTAEDDESSKTSGLSRATSREGSFKNASHVHHKLPDYDTLAAYFQSLRSNVRPK